MNGWLALPLTLLLGQTPTSPTPTDERPPAEQQTQTRTPADDEQRAAQEQELKLLRARVETLQAELEAQQLEDQLRLQSLEEQQATEADRARELEQARQERLASLQRAYQWLITADQRLETGELDIAGPLVYAERELSTVLSSASETGRGQTVRLIESARDRISTLYGSTQERDVYPARLQLQAAGVELQEAWRLTLNRPGSSLVNQ